MNHRPIRLVAAAALLAASTATAQVDYSQVAVSEVLTLAEIQSAVGAANSAALDGLSLAPAGHVGVIHLDALNQPTLAVINVASKSAIFTETAASAAADLGAPYSTNFTLVGEFVWSPTAGASGSFIWSDNSTAAPTEYSLLRTDIATGATTQLLRSTAIAGWNSHGVLPSGQIVGTLGEAHLDLTGEEPVVGLVDPASPAFVPVYDEDEFKAAVVPALTTEEVPPETIGIDPVTGATYVFGHDTFHLFRIDDIEADAALAPASRPGPTWLDIPGWTGVVDLHGMAVDEDGTVYGFDEAAEAIVIWNPATNDTFAYTLDDIGTSLGGLPVAPVLWRGMKARKVNASQSEVLLADSSGDHGVVRLLLGEAPSSVQDWAIID